MATIMIAWELDGGLGHLLPHLPLVKELRDRGHRVVMALRDLSRAGQLFDGLGVELLQAPAKQSPGRNSIPEPRTVAGIIHNSCFEGFTELLGLAEAWRTLYRLVDPDVIVFDYAPTALIAARSHPAKRILFGSGFCCPPDVEPMPDLRPWLPTDVGEQETRDLHVLTDINHLLDRWALPRLERLGQLYSQVDETLLTTIPELDHFPDRPEKTYCGIWPVKFGAAPSWPAGEGPKVFAYLKPFSELRILLEGLVHFRVPTLIYCDGILPEMVTEFSAPTLRFALQPIDIDQAAQQCDLAILNAGHWTTCQMLLAGKPILQIPLTAEQVLNAAAISSLGIGLTALPNESRPILEKLAHMLDSNHLSIAANSVAQRHPRVNADKTLKNLLDRVEHPKGGCSLSVN